MIAEKVYKENDLSVLTNRFFSLQGEKKNINYEIQETRVKLVQELINENRIDCLSINFKRLRRTI